MDRDYSRREVLDIIEREALASGIPRDDFLRFAYIETGGRFDEHASRGPAGAKGLFQFVPGTAAQYGIAGREFDAVENTRAAARLYLDNRELLLSRHAGDDRPYLSGEAGPGGLDMYLAHQQGAGGYRSLQAAIATGQFSLAGTRANLVNNVSARDIEAVTGHTHAQFKAMPDREMAAAFVQYWEVKFDRVRIQEKGIEPVAGAAAPGSHGRRHRPRRGACDEPPVRPRALRLRHQEPGQRAGRLLGLGGGDAERDHGRDQRQGRTLGLRA